MKQITIGITDCGKFGNYQRWLASEPWINIVRLSYKEDNFNEIKNCNGILITGGQDVHPKFYNKPEYLPYCHETDERRDEFELSVLEYTQQHQLPVLGICRGLQIANVFAGGTLLPDIVSAGNADHTKQGETSDRYHQVYIKENSLLEEIVQCSKGEINSAHHQGADKIGHGLMGNATSADGIVEGLERLETNNKPFLLLVQWHPERMNNLESEFSKNIKNRFLESVRITCF
ncbi:MAG TPA: gamma-glutamyl-gamma-aminobutyrate hydrolase family protein [Chitinophagaceae bacterium]|nr:gamma-glutamyl-gamma-aminobutyrate hydrolase family protein [Chitinophagaceae bacterium]